MNSVLSLGPPNVAACGERSLRVAKVQWGHAVSPNAVDCSLRTGRRVGEPRTETLAEGGPHPGEAWQTPACQRLDLGFEEL